MFKRGLLFASVLVIGMGMSVPAWAEEAPSQTEDWLGGLFSSLLSEDSPIKDLFSDSESKETINSLFGEGGELADILPDSADINNVLESVGSQLQDAGDSLHQGINSVVEMAAGEDGSIDWGKVESSAEQLIDIFAGGGMIGEVGGEAVEPESEEDWEAILAEILLPYEKADAVMFDYIADRNADVLETGDAQVFSKTTGYIDDIEQDVVKVLADFTQVNFTIDGSQMNKLSTATDTLLLTLTKGEDGTFTVTDEKQAEAGDEYEASLEALCEEVGIPVDDFYSSSVLGAYNDADALAKYLEEHPEIATAEYQGEQMTAEELRKLADDYINDLFDAIFGEDEEEAATETAAEEETAAETAVKEETAAETAAEEEAVTEAVTE